MQRSRKQHGIGFLGPCDFLALQADEISPENRIGERTHIFVLDESRHAIQVILAGSFHPEHAARMNGMNGEAGARIDARVARSNVDHEEWRLVIALECILDLAPRRQNKVALFKDMRCLVG